MTNIVLHKNILHKKEVKKHKIILAFTNFVVAHKKRDYFLLIVKTFLYGTELV